MAERRLHLSAVVALFLALAGALTANLAEAAHAETSPTITCWGKDRAADNYRKVYVRRLIMREPKTCSLLGPYVDDAHGAILHRLKWHSWGSATATATGYTQSLGANSPGDPTEFSATVSLTDIRGRRDRQWYSLMTVTTRFGAGRYHLSSPTAVDYQVSS
jgi:hypothetical protein